MKYNQLERDLIIAVCGGIISGGIVAFGLLFAEVLNQKYNPPLILGFIVLFSFVAVRIILWKPRSKKK